MSHPDDDTLAGLALGEPAPPEVAEHVRGCASCSEALASLRDTITTLRAPVPELLAPPVSVWDAVSAEIDARRRPGGRRPPPTTSATATTDHDLLRRRDADGTRAGSPLTTWPGSGRSVTTSGDRARPPAVVAGSPWRGSPVRQRPAW